jgi:hypothetical protein
LAPLNRGGDPTPIRTTARIRVAPLSDNYLEILAEETTTMICSVFRRVQKTYAAALAVLFGLASIAPIWAAAPFEIKISEKELKLAFPNDPSWESWLEGDLGFQRMIARSMPFIEITNTGTDPIVEFHLSIANEKCSPSGICTGNESTRFNYAPVQGNEFAVLGRTSPEAVSLTSTINATRDELILNLGGGGLAAGETFRFKINLDVDPNFAAQFKALFGDSQPDFRTVLFDMNGTNVYNNDVVQVTSADNAKAWVVTDPAEGSNITSDPIIFEDPNVDPEVASIINDRLRSGCCCVSDPVLIFIPEPSSAGLVILAVAGVLLRRSGRYSLTA